MPELPEVETVVRSLQRLIAKRKILDAGLIRPRLAPDTEPLIFSGLLKGASINFVHRRGKHILFDLDHGRTLITHLRMSGRFMLLTANDVDPRFTHAVFFLDDETRLLFQDQRHFGYMKIVDTANLHDAKELRSLAPEPFSDEFSLKYFRQSLKSSKRPVKEFLLDQTKVCGLGNIYASEAMFLARVDPREPANSISKRKTSALYQVIRAVLLEAVELGAAREINPENIGGSIYGIESEPNWLVYDRENLPCLKCSRPIARLKQAGRSTYFCTKCQRKRI